MRIHRLWPWRQRWWQKLKYPRTSVPLTEIGETQESEYPWRTGRCRVFRFPGTRHAVAVGEWTGFQPRETVDGIPTLKFRQLENWQDYVGSQADVPGPDLRF